MLSKKNIVHYLYLKQGAHTRSYLWFLSALQSHVRQEDTPQHNTDSLTTGHSHFKES